MDDALIIENKTTKSFSYKKGDVSLSFGLNVDKKEEMEAFVELLKKAAEDVEGEITKL